MPDREVPDKPSKSERKREMLALQKLGEQLLPLSRRELDKMALPEELMEALLLAQRIKSREGLRRQLQYIGKLMRHLDPEPIQQLLEQRQAGQRQTTRDFHALEQLRDELLDSDLAAIEQAIGLYPEVDRSRLSQLVRTARKEKDRQLPPKAARKLFRYLRELAELQDDKSASPPSDNQP